MLQWISLYILIRWHILFLVLLIFMVNHTLPVRSWLNGGFSVLTFQHEMPELGEVPFYSHSHPPPKSMLFALETASNVPVVIGGLLTFLKNFFFYQSKMTLKNYHTLQIGRYTDIFVYRVRSTVGYSPRNVGTSAYILKHFDWCYQSVFQKLIFLPTIYVCFYFPMSLSALDIKRIFNICHFIFCKPLIFSSLYSLCLESRRGALVIITTTTFIWPPSKDSSSIYFIRTWTTSSCKKYS